MNEKWMRPVELMEILMNFLTVFFVETALFSVFSLLEGGAADGSLQREGGIFLPPALPFQLLLAAVPVCFWLIRIFSTRFWPFVLLHAAVFAAAVWLLGRNGFQRTIFGAFSGIYLFVSFRARLQEKREEEGLLGPVAALIAAASSVFLCAYLEDGAACGRILNASLLYAFLFFADTYLRNLERFVQFNRSSNAHIPVRRMLLRGGGLTAACSLAAVALLALGADREFMDRVGELLKSILLWLGKGFFRVLGFLLGFFESGEGETAAAEQGAALPPFMMEEVQERPFWLEVLYQILLYLILIGVAVAAAFLLYKAVAGLIRMFNEGKRKRTQEEEKTVEIRETLRAERKRKERRETAHLFPGTPEEKIRRIFVRTVQKTERFRNPEGKPGKGRGKDLWRRDARERLLRAKTARELDFLFLDGTVQKEEGSEERQRAFLELAELYEKARYARKETSGGCTLEDVKRAEDCRAVLLGRKKGKQETA